MGLVRFSGEKDFFRENFSFGQREENVKKGLREHYEWPFKA